MYLAILYLPLLGAICAGLFGRYLGNSGAQIITILNVGLTFLFSVLIFIEVALRGSICYLKLFN